MTITKQRNVSVELLRVIAMLMVLGLHANFMSFAIPTATNVLSFNGIFRVFMEAICYVAVNTFVMISGWFGIKATIKGFSNFMWQVIYVVGLLFIIGVLFFNVPANIYNILGILGLYGGGGWFVAAYIGLYILSPVLNAYIKNTPNKNIALFLIAFFSFQFIWGNTHSVVFIGNGYSTFSFIGIYILAGLLRKCNDEDNSIMKYFRGGTFILTVIINTILYVVGCRLQLIALMSYTLNYINPLVILGAASLLVTFAGKPESFLQKGILRNFILWLSASCFAVYLLHVGMSWALLKYCEGVQAIYDKYSAFSGFAMAMILLYMISVFILAILIDQPRKFLWRKVISKLLK
ncbi:MAG: acyltransferase family protein [Bacteroidales bacterium]|nr:acyltransferase family protein [Bacteroidales bacterium]